MTSCFMAGDWAPKQNPVSTSVPEATVVRPAVVRSMVEQPVTAPSTDISSVALLAEIAREAPSVSPRALLDHTERQRYLINVCGLDPQVVKALVASDDIIKLTPTSRIGSFTGHNIRHVSGIPVVIGSGPLLPADATTTMPSFQEVMTARLRGSSQ